MRIQNTKVWLVVILIAACAASFAQTKQQAGTTFPGIKKLMSHDEFTKAGLTKLDDAEIQALDEWLQKYSANVAKAITAITSSETGGDIVETYIDGDFEGWDGDTVWKLDNGQIWQQSSYAYHYHYAFHPKVLIYRASGGWKMKVEGDSTEVSVKKIK